MNTKKIIHARFPVRNGKADVRGDYAIAGVAGTGARIRLDFLSPGGTQTGALLPTGQALEEIDGLACTLVDAANPAVFFAAADFGLTGEESPDAIEAIPGLMARLDVLRRMAGVRMGLAAAPEKVGLAAPRIALLASPGRPRLLDGSVMAPESHDIQVRMLSMERVHHAVPLTGALGLACACKVAGSLPARLCGELPRADEIRVGQPSGMLAVGAEVRQDNTGWRAESAVVYRTARTLMVGAVAIRA